jgi:hypothetical protein
MINTEYKISKLLITCLAVGRLMSYETLNGPPQYFGRF